MTYLYWSSALWFKWRSDIWVRLCEAGVKFFFSPMTSRTRSYNKPRPGFIIKIKNSPECLIMPQEEVVVHSKKCWVVSTQIWVKYGQTQMLGKKCS